MCLLLQSTGARLSVLHPGGWWWALHGSLPPSRGLDVALRRHVVRQLRGSVKLKFPRAQVAAVPALGSLRSRKRNIRECGGIGVTARAFD